jgi:hypothetical protein
MGCNNGSTDYYGFEPGENKIIPFENIYLWPLKSCDDEFKNFTEGRGDCEWEKCWYNFAVNGETRSNVSYPKITLPKPKIKRFDCPSMLYYSDMLDVTLYVKDDFGKHGKAKLKAINVSSGKKKWEIEILSTEAQYEYGLWIYKWRLPPDEHLFTKDDKCSNFSLQANYSGLCGEDNSTRITHITEYHPKKEVAHLNKMLLEEDEWYNIYVKKEDLAKGDLSFDVTIKDKIKKGNATLKVCRIDNNGGCLNYSLRSDEKEVYPYEYTYYNNSIRFNESDKYKNFSLHLYYDRPKLPSPWPSPWNIYNLTIIPFYIKFENPTVSPKTGNWSDTFNYSVDVNASKGLNIAITLRVFDPYREPEPWIPLGAPDIEEPPTVKWSDQEPFEKYCAGQSKFYFEYHIEEFKGESPVYLGPYLGPRPEPPEFDNGTTNPNVTIYCNWSKSSTLCNYSVNVSAEDEYKVRLLVKDPDSNDWIPKGDIKEISSTTKNITWTDITPFESLNIDNITQYIGKRANYTFEYDGHRYEEKTPFPGPELVAAFKDPKVELEPGDEVINYNDTFYYSVNVIGSEKLLNITLRYLCDGKWISENITKPTKEYNSITKWQQLNWTCKAINSWEEVRFDVNVTGREKPIEVY